MLLNTISWQGLQHTPVTETSNAVEICSCLEAGYVWYMLDMHWSKSCSKVVCVYLASQASSEDRHKSKKRIDDVSICCFGRIASSDMSIAIAHLPSSLTRFCVFPEKCISRLFRCSTWTRGNIVIITLARYDCVQKNFYEFYSIPNTLGRATLDYQFPEEKNKFSFFTSYRAIKIFKFFRCKKPVAAGTNRFQ